MAIQNLSGSGFEIQLIALPTIPFGIKVKSFAGDADPLDIAQLTYADFTMGLNGDLILSKRPTPITISLRTIPGTDEDIAMERLFDANRVAANKVSYLDIITMTFLYPSGMRKVLTDGAIVGGTPIVGMNAQGMLKSNKWDFVFGGKSV